jgi:SulP family sulfate permease
MCVAFALATVLKLPSVCVSRLVAGIASLLLGLLRAGNVVRFLSHPVLKGFTAAAAVIIATSQASAVLGVRLPRRTYAWQTWADAVLAIASGEAHGVTVALAAGSFVLFMALHRLRVFLRSVPSIKERPAAIQAINSFPSALVVVIVMIAIVGGARLDKEGVAVVGKIEPGLPAPRVPVASASFGADVGRLWVSALISALIGFMEAISVAKAMALRFGTPLDPNQEFLGLGAANAIGSFFNAQPQTGAFSRTVVNGDAGAKTQLAGVVSALVLVLVVLFLTTLFEFLPLAALGAMIVFAVTGLVELGTPRLLFAVDRRDLFVYTVAFVATVGLGIEQGILIGAAISLARVVQESTTPHVAEMGKMPESKMPRAWRSLTRFPGEATRVTGVRVLRFDSPLYFANAMQFRDVVLDMAAARAEEDAPPRAIIVDCSAVSMLDSTALAVIEGIPTDLAKTADSGKLMRLERLLDAAAAAGMPFPQAQELRKTPAPPKTSAQDYHPVIGFRAARGMPFDDRDLVQVGTAGVPVAGITPAQLAERYLAVLALPPAVPLFFLSCITVSKDPVMRVPEQPKGWPRAIAPP